MASTVQTPVYSHPPSSFAAHERSTSMNGSFSQPALPPSFDTSRSMALTPTATRPPQDALQQQQQPQQPHQQPQMSFTISGAPGMNGLVSSGNSFGGYGEANGHPQPSPYYEHDAKPQIYTVGSTDSKPILRSLNTDITVGCLFQRICV